MNLATLKKLVLGYIVAVPILIVITVVQFTSVQGVVDTHRKLGSAHDVIRQADDLGSLLSRAAASWKDFLATRKAAALEPYQSASPQAREKLDALAKRAAGDPPQLARVKKLDGEVNRQLELFRKALEVQVPPGLKSPPPNEAFLEGEKQWARADATLAEIREHERNHLPALAAAAQESLERANRLAPLAGFLAVWMVLVAALLLYRDTTRRTWAGIERRIHTRVVEAMPIGVCLVDEHGLIIYTNAALDSLFGYEPGGMIGRHITAAHNTVRGEGDDLFDRAMEDLARAGEWRGDFLAKRKNTTTFPCASQAVPMELSGKMYRLFLMAAGAPSAAA